MNRGQLSGAFIGPRTRFTIGLGLVAALATVTLVTAAAWFALDRRMADIVMLYLLGVVIIAIRFGYAPSLLASALSVGAFDFFFLPPYFSFSVNDKHFVLTLFIMLFVALVISNLMEGIRRSDAAARDRERETQTERLRNAVLSSVSHDLRTPLAVIMGAATALIGGDELPKARRRQYLETISNEASRLNRLVRKLLDMTSLEAGAMRPHKEWQPLEEVVGVSLNRLEEPLESRPVTVRIPPEASLAPFDASLVEQVLINLVENAIKYTPRDTGIEISARRVDEGVEVDVADVGPGVPAGKEQEIFEKFNRAGTVDGGMGIGLTICRGIVVAHGGRIWCENKPSGGASFRFVLPYEGEPPPMRALPEAVGDP